MNNTKILKKHLGSLIASARLDTHTTQAILAKKMKIKQPNISRAEREGCDIEFAVRCLEKMGFMLDPNAMRAIDPRKQGLVFCP